MKKSAKATKEAPDGAQAYKLAGDMENDIRRLEQISSTLFQLRDSCDRSERIHDALQFVASALEDATEAVGEKQEAIWRATSGYAKAAQATGA